MYRYTSRYCLLLSVSWATLSSTICAQPLPNGIQLGKPAHGVSIIVPPSMTQCESFLVYYNITNTTSPFVAIYRSDMLRDALLTLLPPAPAVGYIDWTCNIPAGHSLVVAVRTDITPGLPYNSGVLRGQDYIVRSSDSSSCLTDLTTTYSVANYGTEFRSYTSAGIGYVGTPTITYESGTTTRFPTTRLSTISANPGLTRAGVSKETKKNNTLAVAVVLGVISGVLAGLAFLYWSHRCIIRSIQSTVYDKTKFLESDPLAMPPSPRESLGSEDQADALPTSRMSSDHAMQIEQRTDISTGSHDLAISLEDRLSRLTSLQRQTVLAHLDTHPDSSSSSSTSFPSTNGMSSNDMPRSDPSPNMEVILDTISILSPAEARVLAAYIRRTYDVDQPGTAWGEKLSRDQYLPPYGA